MEGGALQALHDKSFRRGLTDLILGGSRQHRAKLDTIRTGPVLAAVEATKVFTPTACDQSLLLGISVETRHNPDIAFAALLVLWHAADPIDRYVFAEVLQDRHRSVMRGQAAEALGDAMWGGDRRSPVWRKAARTLISALDDDSSDVRFNAAWGLGVAKVRAALPSLRRVVAHDRSQSTHGSVAKVARGAIEQMGTGPARSGGHSRAPRSLGRPVARRNREPKSQCSGRSHPPDILVF